MDLEAGTVFAGYTVVREIGTGGMGSVYLVRHPRLPRQDAMKVIHSHLSSDHVFAARFDREAAIACTLDHPSLVKVYDRGLDDGRLWLTMQFIDGHDADQVLRMDGPMAPARAVRVISAIADALDHAHETGLVHRDVKPANILLSMRGTGGERAYLADFGIAHASGKTRELTDTGSLLASLPYAAPEQLLDKGITGAVDVYALGCVLYELLTARRLFDQETPPALMGAVLSGPRADSWAALPPGRPQLEQVIRPAIAQNPEDRFPTCSALAEAAREAVAPAGVTTVRRQPLEELQPVGPPQWTPPPAPPTGPPMVPTTGPITGPQQQWPAPPWPVQQDRRSDTGPVWSNGAATGGPPGHVRQVGGPPRRRWWPWAAAAVLVVAAVVAGLLFFLPGDLGAPSSVTAEPYATGVEVRWQPVDGAQEYQVHRDGDLVAETRSTTYLDDGVGSGVNATYTVAAVGADSERSALSSPTTVLSPLHAVGNLAADVDGVSIRLTWAPVTNADRYEVRRGDEVVETDVDGASFADEVTEAGQYEYTVLAYDDAGAEPSMATARAEVSPWLGSDEIAAAFDELLPDEPGAGGWGDATCEIGELNDTSTASDAIVCTHPSGIYVEYTQFPDQAALDSRIAFLDTLADPEAPGSTADQGWYRQSTADANPAWEAWGFAEGNRRLMEIYIQWEGHSIADLDSNWFYEAPWDS
jgi:serine/threonine protein kinase